MQITKTSPCSLISPIVVLCQDDVNPLDCLSKSSFLLTVHASFMSYLVVNCNLDGRFSGGYAKLSLVVRKPAFCICENKDADQLRGNREADLRLCFRYTDSTIPLLPTS